MYVANLSGTTLGAFTADTTDEKGRAATLIRLGTIAAPAHLKVSVPERGLTAQADYTVLPGAAVRVGAAPADTAVYVGNQVQLRGATLDQHGNRRADPVTYSPGSGALTVTVGGLVAGRSIARSYVVVRASDFTDTTRITWSPAERWRPSPERQRDCALESRRLGIQPAYDHRRLRCERTGAILWYHGFVVPVAGDEPEDAPVWPQPTMLDCALPAGPGAEPAAALDQVKISDWLAQAPVLLDRYREGLRRTRLAGKSIERHAGNASDFVDYLIAEGVPLRACTEYDLRVFLYDWYPRKVRTTRAVARAMLESLRRFFIHLDQQEDLSFPWARAILTDRFAFDYRYDAFPGGFWWDAEVQDWQAELYDDLAARALLADSGMAGGRQWGATMGREEFELRTECQRRWLLWRDELVGHGLVDPDAVGRALVQRQREWETASHPGRGNRSPVDVVIRERAAAER